MSNSATGCSVQGSGETLPQKEVETAPFQLSPEDVAKFSPNTPNGNFDFPVPDNDDKIGPQKVKATSYHRKKPYTEPFLQEMLSNVRNGIMSMYHVDKYYGIPRATLQYRLGSEYKGKERSGPDPVLTPEEESVIVKWVQTMERRGFPITRRALIARVAAYLRKNPRENPCRDNKPGRRWLEGFMRRHSELTFRTPESVTSASAKVSEEDIRKWFLTVLDYLIEHNLIDALYDPSRVLNGDETGFVMDSSPKKVLATKGVKNVSTVDTQNGKQNVTVLFSFSADGNVVPPDVILPYKRLSREIVQSFPSDWGLGTSETGWMNASNFALYIKKVLYPSLVKRNVKFPVLYFVDGHKSHTALEAADACAELGIVLIALYPNATRILQPADVSIFRPLKNSWRRIVEIWKTEQFAERLSIPTFGSLLKETMDIAFKKETIINAFRACGLYPFNANAVDYSKCIARPHSQPEPSPLSTKATALPMVERQVTIVPTTAIECAVRMIGDEKINLYKSGDQTNFSREDKVLSFIYHNILTANQPINYDMAENCEQPYEVKHLNYIDLQAAMAEPVIILEDGTEFDADLSTNNMMDNCEQSYDVEHSNNVDLHAAIAEPFIIFENGSEFASDLSSNDPSSVQDYGHQTENSLVDPNVHLQLISNVPKDLKNIDLVADIAESSMLFEEGTDQAKNDEILQGEEGSNEDISDIDPVAVIDESLVLYEEGIARDLQLISDFTANQSGIQAVTNNGEHYYDVDDPDALYFNDISLDWNLDLEQDNSSSEPNPSAIESHGVVLKTNGSSNIRVSAAEFFQAPPTPKRNPNHRNYKQKSYAILTAGERLEELRKIEIDKEQAEIAKKIKAEERTKKKLLKEEEKENARKVREMKRQVAAQAKLDKTTAKKSSGKTNDKKKVVL